MEQFIKSNANWEIIPDYMREGIERWVNHGVPPGHFMQAILKNDLKSACGRADETNKHCLYNYVFFLYNWCPGACWGSPERYQEWFEYHKSLRAANEHQTS